jgi:integrase
MAVYKESDTNTWRVVYRYTDWTGESKQSSKRGFAAKRDALAWEREQLRKAQSDLSMTFGAFVELYSSDMKTRLRQNTWLTKENIINKKLLPYFGNKRMSEITAKDIIQWQNEMMKMRGKDGKPFSATYLKTLHNQVSAIFNHAVRFYDLKYNPAAKAGSIGKKEAKDMLFWTKDEYMKFADSMMDKPISFYAFEMLYWCGIRMGELLALVPGDFDFDKSTVTINKSYQRLTREDIITEPKTPKSNRIISMPDFLCQQMKEYIHSLYGCMPTDRIFPITKSYLHHEMDRGSKEQGVKRIRVHDIRHSYVKPTLKKYFLNFGYGA